MPVDIIIGFPVLDMYLIRGKFVISPDAILYADVPSSSKKSTLVVSHGVHKKVIYFPLQ
jgi:hypothetical protein